MDDPDSEVGDKTEALTDPAYQKAVFSQAYHQTNLLLDDAGTNSDIQILGRINALRNEAIDEVAADFATKNGAECCSGCSSCCHQMVLCTPLEIFQIAYKILNAKQAVEVVRLKERLSTLAPLPIDEASRHGLGKPCALLENNGCSIYEYRPSLCRTMLSTSRAACEKSLNLEEQTVPFIAEPVVISFLMQLGIDYALIKSKHLSTGKIEMSRALLIALENFETAFQNWINGTEAFPNCYPETGSGPSYSNFVEQVAAQSGIV